MPHDRRRAQWWKPRGNLTLRRGWVSRNPLPVGGAGLPRSGPDLLPPVEHGLRHLRDDRVHLGEDLAAPIGQGAREIPVEHEPEQGPRLAVEPAQAPAPGQREEAPRPQPDHEKPEERATPPPPEQPRPP